MNATEYAGDVSGTCYIWQETYRSSDTNSIQMQSFIRSCDTGDERPMNQWTEISSKADNLKLCQGDKCNIDDLDAGSSASVFGVLGLMIMLI